MKTTCVEIKKNVGFEMIWVQILLVSLIMIPGAKSFSFRHFRPFRASFIQLTSRLFSSADDTIYALSSGPLTKSGVAVVRLSGPSALECYQKLVKTPQKSTIAPRAATLKSFFCPFSNDMLDKGIAIWFPSPRSFTGEDVIELHLHGSRAVINSLFQVFERLSTEANINIRPAEPGEFSRRAFENGKMDLTEVEGLSDLLAAETANQRKQALRQMEGHARVIFEKWR